VRGRWLYIFFLSSRRRHTRLVSDWSSDVCSSDLELHGCRLTPARDDEVEGGPPEAQILDLDPVEPRRQHRLDEAQLILASVGRRSEERRVGEEGWVRGWRERER